MAIFSQSVTSFHRKLPLHQHYLGQLMGLCSKSVQILETLILHCNKFTMSKIGHLQNCFEIMFDKFTLQFMNKMHWTQLQYKVEGNKRMVMYK